MSTCSKCVKTWSSKELFNCDDCRSVNCISCSGLTATELKVMELKKKTKLFRCGECTANTYTKKDVNELKLKIEYLEKEISMLKEQVSDKNIIISDKTKIITLQEEKLGKNQFKHEIQKTNIKKSDKETITQPHQKEDNNKKENFTETQNKTNKGNLYSTITKTSYEELANAQATKTSQLININNDILLENKTTKKTIKKKKINYGSNKVDRKFQGTPKKIWLFISRVNKDVSKNDIIEFLTDKPNLREREFIVEEVQVNRTETKCFKVGADYDLLEVIYKPDFWPNGIGYSRYYFPKEHNKGTFNGNSFSCLILKIVVKSCFGSNLDMDCNEKIQQFLKDFLELQINVTPKLHAIFIHIHKFCLLKNCGLGKFSLSFGGRT
ncbi:unnamed protein product [Brassicogethes aeneus]|uniref:Uncharacterized protein n=1 Tax=Brassicogethes aeneus TaxID=1431903 RepID=A0A9P0FIU1_BRAAE|nr:unnamed protein product [Brassicogethes aeneus]